MRVALGVLAVLAGCYNPGVDPCVVRCAASGACPTDLICNEQHFCATSSTTSCPGVTPDASDELTPVSVEVFAPNGDHAAGAVVYFSDRDGTLLGSTATSTDGVASKMMREGGSVTVVQKYADRYDVTTFLRLWPNAKLVSQHTLDGAVRPIVVDFGVDGSAFNFAVYTSCNPFPVQVMLATSNTTVNVPARCGEFDVVVVGTATGDPSSVNVRGIARRTASPVTVTGDPMPMISLAGMLAPIKNATQATVSMGALVSTDLPRTGRATEALVSNGTFTIPVAAQYARSAQVKLEYTEEGVTSAQSLLEVVPASATSYTPVVDDVVLPWIRDAGIDRDERRLTWRETAPEQIRPGVPDFVVGTLRVQQATGGGVISWRLIAPLTEVATTDGRKSIQFPAFPEAPFALRGSDMAISNKLELIGVDDGAARDLMSSYERRAADLNFFSRPGVTQVVISASPL